MRTARVTLEGVEYPLCFSTRVVRACIERYGDIGGLYTATSTGDQLHDLDESLWLLSTMLDAGARHGALTGADTPKPPTHGELYDLCSMADLVRIRQAIQETVTAGQSRSVEAEPPKNTGATPGAN